MSKYVVMYRCLLCNTLIQYGEPMEMPLEMLPDFCNRVIQNQVFAGNPYLHKAPMQMIHTTCDKGCGVAYFAGLKKG